MAKKTTKSITKKEKQKYKAFFEDEKGIFIIEKFTSDIIERCKLPEAVELRKKLGYNYDDINDSRRNINSRKNNKAFP